MADSRVRTVNGMPGPKRRKPASEYDPEGRAGDRYEDLRDNMRKGWNGDPPRKR